MKKIVTYIFALIVLAAAIFLIGPRPPTDETIHFRADSLGANIEAYLSSNETKIANLIPGAEKEIIWDNPVTKTKTPLVIIYLHGFSATKMEVRPVPDNVAKSLGANLYFARLTGHGVGGHGLGETTMNDWVNDLAEAIAIGEQLGEKIVFLTTSTGGTLAILGTKFPHLMTKVSGMVLLSPNFAVHGVSNDLMNMPWGTTLLPLVFGEERSRKPENEQHAKWWTTSYPTKAVFSLAALLRQVEAIDKSKITLPALFVYSKNDQTVQPSATDDVVKIWGGSAEVMIVETPEDTSNHVIAGDIRNPTMTKLVSERIIQWINDTQ